MTEEKIVVDGALVWPNPDYPYDGVPIPEQLPVATSSYPTTFVKVNPAWRIACQLGKVRGIAYDGHVRRVTHFDDGRVMADVLINGEWGRYACTADEIEARKGGQRVDAALEVVA